jgi:two-component system sensor histidine kinase RegB
MRETEVVLWRGQDRSSWIRLRTLIWLRWVAIGGQAAAITVARHTYNLQLDMALCVLAIGISAAVNVLAMYLFPQNKRLSEAESFATVLFDLLQLAFLLYLTGGLHNPFAMLMLGPVVISANILGMRSTLLIGGTAIILVTALAWVHVPLLTELGYVLRMPEIFVFGHWVALIITISFLGLYSQRVSFEIRSMADALSATQMALSSEQKLTDLGGVIAAAAHELGTPLATIKLASSELIEDLDDRPDLQEDARLIREQTDRCRDILRDMGRAGKDDLHLRQAPLSTVVHEAAEPHMQRGKTIHFDEGPEGGASPQQPSVLRMPEIIHGLRNLIQNAVDFAAADVWVETRWNEDRITIRIIDDGHGYPTHLIGRIGDPFVRRRRSESDRQQRPGYEGMGLGLFIAKTLLQRSGARIAFANARDPAQAPTLRPEQRGAVVKVTWPRAKIDAIHGDTPVPVGRNQPIRP